MAALALMLGSVGVWLMSRTMGLPFLPGGHMEPIGFKDAVTVLFELATVPDLLLLLSRDASRMSLPSTRLGTQALAFLGAAAFALMVPALVLGGGGHHSADQMAHAHGEEDGHALAGGHARPEHGRRTGGQSRRAADIREPRLRAQRRHAPFDHLVPRTLQRRRLEPGHHAFYCFQHRWMRGSFYVE